MVGYDRPFVTISAAATIDGKISTTSGDSAISSKRDLVRVHRLRTTHDAILVGVKTILSDDPLLTVRHWNGANPIRVVLDPAGRTPVRSRLLRTCDYIPTILVLTEQADRTHQERLKKAGATILQMAGDHIDLGRMLHILYGRGIHTILVEGGGHTIWGFIAAGVFDQIILTISPYVAGGPATSLVAGEGFGRLAEGPRLDLMTVQQQGNEVVLHYVVRSK